MNTTPAPRGMAWLIPRTQLPGLPMIRFACPGCNATYTVEDAKGGKAGKCPKCQAQFVIPPADAAAGSSSAPAPSPPPPPATNATVEIKPCPKCSARLSVAPSDIGVDVECPYCQAVYTAQRAGAPAPDRPIRRREEDRPSRRRPLAESEEEDRPSRRRRGEDDEDDRPSRRSRDEDEDDEEDDRPRKKKRRRNYEPHRGGLILGLGIASFIVCGIFTAIPAWIMGSADLKKIDSGRMDPDGRGLTQAGRILGIIATCLTAVALLFYCVIFIIAIAGGAAGAAGGARGGPGGFNPNGPGGFNPNGPRVVGPNGPRGRPGGFNPNGPNDF